MDQSHSIDVTEVVNGARFGSYQFLVVSLCIAIAAFDGYDTQSIGYVAPLIAKDLGIGMASLGPIFGAGLVGLTLGAILFGTLADWIGRKWAALLSILVFALFSLATPSAGSFQTMLLIRFLAGVGLGGALPNVVALTAEYVPERVRGITVNMVNASFAFGSILGGLISAKIVPVFGWHAVFYIGGVVPLFSLVFFIIWLPESLQFLVVKGSASADIARILGRITRRPFDAAARYVLPEAALTGFSVKHLFRQSRALMTILLWIAFFMNLLVLLLLIQWLPSLLSQAGLPLEQAILTTVSYNVGGVIGALILGRLIDGYGAFIVLVVSFVFTAFFIGVAASSLGNQTLLVAALVLAGAGVNGNQASLNTLASSLYQTAIRSTGVGWALGIGRIGAILGPVLAGILVAAHWDSRMIIMVTIVPNVIAAITILILWRTRPARP